MLSWPYGQLLVGTMGTVLVIAGLGFGYQAVTTNFQERLKRERMFALAGDDTVALGLGCYGAYVLVETVYRKV